MSAQRRLDKSLSIRAGLTIVPSNSSQCTILIFFWFHNEYFFYNSIHKNIIIRGLHEMNSLRYCTLENGPSAIWFENFSIKNHHQRQTLLLETTVKLQSVLRYNFC